MKQAAAARWPLPAAAVLFAVTYSVFWPGVALYDTVAQFGQVLSGEVDDWHPPVMVRLWMVLHAVVGGAGGPMFALQVGLYWTGLGLIAGALARDGRSRAALAVLLVGVWPPFLGWQVALLKDAQMAGAILAAGGLVAWRRLSDRNVPRWTWASVAILLVYATLVRANALFATVPLAVALVPRWRLPIRVAATAAGMAAVLLAAGPINHGLLDAGRSGVERTQALYDLAGIAVRTGDAPKLGPNRIAALAARRCVKPFFWDPLGDASRCNALVEPLRDVPVGPLYAMLARAALRHPLAYAEQRLAHVNSTERWLVPAYWPSAAPPVAGQPNELGLQQPGSVAAAVQRFAGRLVETPPAWPAFWTSVALGLTILAVRRPASPARDLALALLASALTVEASFVLLSIASDLRYHLWPMLASALALVLLAPFGSDEVRWRRAVFSLVLLVTAAGLIARLVLPTPPLTYAAMLA